MICEHCKTDAGRTTKGAACCELRMLASAPEKIVMPHLAGLSEAGRGMFMREFLTEIARLAALHRSQKRTKNHDASGINS